MKNVTTVRAAKKILEKNGYRLTRRKSTSHMQFENPTNHIKITLPSHGDGCEIHPFLWSNIIKRYALSV